MDRYKEIEYECHNCDQNYTLGFEIEDDPICCPFCGSLEIKKHEETEEEDDDKEPKDDDED